MADESTYHYRGLYRATRAPSCVLTLDDIRRLYTELDAKTVEAVERYLDTVVQPADMDAEQFANAKQMAREQSHLTVTVLGGAGEQLVSRSVEMLADASLPEQIHDITFDSAAALRASNITPQNRFTLRIDFTEPPTFDAYNPWDQPTPNQSKLEVMGSDQTWVTGVYESTLGFFRRRQRKRDWLHSQHFFNWFHWLLGIPLSFWIVYRLDSSISLLQTTHPALRGAVDVYFFLVALLVVRQLVWAFRWVFPVIELQGTRSTKARALLGAVAGSLMLAVAYDVLKTLVLTD